MATIKTVDISNISNNLAKSSIKPIDKIANKITNTIETATLESSENTSTELTDVTPLQSAPSYSTNLLREKLVGTAGMGTYGVVKGIIETNPKIPASINLTECLIENTITSKPTSIIVNKSFETANKALMPEVWTSYGEEAFIKTETSFATPGKIIGNNVNVVRSAGARLNVGINAAFAAMDSKKVWDHYEENGDKGINHIGEISGRFIGETAGGAGGFAAGLALGTAASAAVTGAVCGSVVPGVGTAVGLFVGAVVGATAAVVAGDAGATIGSVADGMGGKIVAL